VILVGTDISEECNASIIKVTRISVVRTALALTSFWQRESVASYYYRYLQFIDYSHRVDRRDTFI
jgi:hypothetical protein